MVRVPTEEGSETGELVRRSIAGDHQAFSLLYTRYARSVAATVASRLSGADDRADAVQETFIKAWQRLDSMRDPEQFLPWLYAIARNMATSVGRSKTRHQADTIDDATPVVSAGATATELLEAAELLRVASAAGALLSHRDATVLSMVVNFGFGPAEIAVALGVTENNAGVILHRARQRLRKELVVRGAIVSNEQM